MAVTPVGDDSPLKARLVTKRRTTLPSESKRRLVQRADHTSDGRSHLLSLSLEGARLHAEISPLALAYEAALIAGLAPSEVALLKRLLMRLQGAANALGGDTPPVSSPGLGS